MMLRILACAAALLLTASAAQPLSTVRNSVGFIQGTINGEGPYWFLIDSGANRSALDDDECSSTQKAAASASPGRPLSSPS
jgi:hypothetical protein